jgi:hypothetical protein
VAPFGALRRFSRSFSRENGLRGQRQACHVRALPPAPEARGHRTPAGLRCPYAKTKPNLASNRESVTIVPSDKLRSAAEEEVPPCRLPSQPQSSEVCSSLS